MNDFELDLNSAELFRLIAPQTQRVYRASEESFNAGHNLDQLVNGGPGDFKSVKQLADYAESIRQSDFVKQTWPVAFWAGKPKYELWPNFSYDSTGFGLQYGAATHHWDRVLSFTKNDFANKKESVIHELAHLIAADQFGLEEVSYDDREGHGSIFLEVQLQLLQKFFPDKSKVSQYLEKLRFYNAIPTTFELKSYDK